mmetsp:Transcript_80158/g.249068  ORF Transcript_80158/g.249068 Transcript_80158/m.249068 type:complete len:324 (-) Transcript_80158:525-1496(-)
MAPTAGGPWWRPWPRSPGSASRGSGPGCSRACCSRCTGGSSSACRHSWRAASQTSAAAGATRRLRCGKSSQTQCRTRSESSSLACARCWTSKTRRRPGPRWRPRRWWPSLPSWCAISQSSSIWQPLALITPWNSGGESWRRTLTRASASSAAWRRPGSVASRTCPSTRRGSASPWTARRSWVRRCARSSSASRRCWPRSSRPRWPQRPAARRARACWPSPARRSAQRCGAGAGTPSGRAPVCWPSSAARRAACGASRSWRSFPWPGSRAAAPGSAPPCPASMQSSGCACATTLARHSDAAYPPGTSSWHRSGPSMVLSWRPAL